MLTRPNYFGVDSDTDMSTIRNNIHSMQYIYIYV